MREGRLTGRVAIVTGAARGIGLAAAGALGREGARVLLSDIDVETLEGAVSRLKGAGLEVMACPADVTDRAAVAAMAAAAPARWGRLDILVNNAAIPDATPFADLVPERWHEVLAANLDSVLYCTQAAMPHLLKSPVASIINIASTQGLRGQPVATAYATAKAGVVNLTRCMAVDFGPHGVRVNAIAPGYIDTRMAILPDGAHEHQSEWFQEVYIKHGRLPLRRPGTVEDVAGPILFLASDDSRYVTGQILVVDGGLTATY